MELKILTDKEINEEVANEIVELINKKPNAVLGLATGGSPVGVYKELIKKYNEKEVSFKYVKTYNLDEYIGLTKDNKESYYYFMCHNLFNYIDVNMNNVHLPDGINYEDSIANYEKSIASDGGIDYVEFRTVMIHLPPSIFYVTLKSAEERSNAAHSNAFIISVP